MDARTLEALHGSIRKWELIVEGKGEDKGSDNCPLCGLFITNGCEGCPVRETTDLPGCLGTPYQEWGIAHIEAGRYAFPKRIHDDDTAIAAVLELEFLRSLLPEGK